MTAWHQVAGLIAQGVRVHLYAGSCEKGLRGLSSLHQTLVVSGLKLPYRLIGHKRAMAIHDKIVARALRRIVDKIDIIHCWPSGSLETLKTAQDLGIKTVLERPNTHTRYAMEVVAQECKRLGIKMPPSHSHTFDAARLKREEEEFALADKLLCPSQFAARTFLDMGFTKDRIALHRYGFDPSVFNVSSDSLSSADKHPFRMIFVGSCEPRKGLHYALDAWLTSKACANGIFYICGKYIPGYRELLADKLARPSIKEVGFLSNVAPLMRNCHALVLPTIEDGFGLVTCEARACGCVLLVSNAACEACEHMKTGLVHEAGDVDTLRHNIDLLASDRKLLSQLRNNSLATAHEWTWEKAAECLIDIYRRTLDQKTE